MIGTSLFDLPLEELLLGDFGLTFSLSELELEDFNLSVGIFGSSAGLIGSSLIPDLLLEELLEGFSFFGESCLGSIFSFGASGFCFSLLSELEDEGLFGFAGSTLGSDG